MMSASHLGQEPELRARPEWHGARAGHCHSPNEMEKSLSKNTRGERKSFFYLNMGTKYKRKYITPSENSAEMVALGEK